MRRSALFIAIACICAVLAASILICVAQEKNEKQAREDFIPSPIFSPPYPPLPHHFSDLHTIQILCQAPKGAIKKALMPPLEQGGEGDLFVMILGWTPDVEGQGYNVHEIAINAPVRWKEGRQHHPDQYIDSDIGIDSRSRNLRMAKKMAEITWTRRPPAERDGQQNEGSGNIPLMKIEYTISDSTLRQNGRIWGLLGKAHPECSPSTPSFNQIVRVGCNVLEPRLGRSSADGSKAKETKGPQCSVL